MDVALLKLDGGLAGGGDERGEMGFAWFQDMPTVPRSVFAAVVRHVTKPLGNECRDGTGLCTSPNDGWDVRDASEQRKL